MSPTPLPVDELLPELVEALASNARLVLRAATGAGKTTRVPPALLRPQGQVFVLEPRRVAARAAAARVAEERGTELGREVGYQVRFDNRTGPETRLVYATEGIFLRRLQGDPFLDGVHTVVLDEFHERSLVGDTVLALVRLLQSTVRDDLRLVVMSATLAFEDLGERLQAPMLDSVGRSFPVEIDYLSRPDSRPVPARVADAVRRLVSSPGEGEGLDSVLAFLPGRGELTRTAERLQDLDVPVEQLYGDLPLDQQTRVLRSSRRRVVLATNVAETSVTVDGIGAVVDSGLHRELRFDPATGLDRLELLPISRAAADQRAGRAGRQGPGRALRLWTPSEQAQRLPASKPEIERVDLSAVALLIASQGERAEDLPWLDPPPPASLERARVLLQDLGALDASGITELGQRLAALPVHPRLGRILLDGADRNCVEPAARLAALLSERDPVIDGGRPDHGAGRSVEHPTDSDVFDRLESIRPEGRGPRSLRLHSGRVDHILRTARQLEGLVGTSKTRTQPGLATQRRHLTRCLLDAFPDRVALLEASQDRPNEVIGRMVGDIGVGLSPRSRVALAPGTRSLALCTELGGIFQAGDRRRSVVHAATLIDAEDLDAERIVEQRVVWFDESTERVEGARVTLYRVGVGAQVRTLELARRPAPADPEQAAALLAEQAKRDPDHALGLDDGAFAVLRRRLDFVHRATRNMNDAEPLPAAEALPTWTSSTWSEVIDHLAPGCRSLGDLRQAATGWITHLLDHAQRTTLDRLAPERVELPNGRTAAIDYAEDGPPILAARIQDLFGWQDTPTILDGRQRLLLHLLAPNMRPQQITDDLRGFWTGSYELVRKELAGRYPKHAWPTNPLEADPVRPRRR